jgi:PPOX class probable F420-dependent enzyme
MHDAPSATQRAAARSEGAGDTAALEHKRYISVTTFRRNGEGVATPVEFVVQGTELYVRASGMGKVKRIRDNPRVRVAPCTMRGRVTGAAVDGTASLLDDEETAALYELFSKKYGFLWRLGMRLRRPRVQGVRILVSSPSEAA